MSKQESRVKLRSIIGLGFIVFALLMVFDNLGFHVIGKVLSHWPIALIVLGGAMLYGPIDKTQTKVIKGNLPYFLIGFGVLFFLAQHHFFNFSFSSLIVPAILLAVGVHILKPNGKKDSSYCSVDQKENTENVDSDHRIVIEGELESKGESRDSSFKNGDNRMDVFNILGGSEYSTSSKNLQGGSVVCILGGAEIDIREADAAENTIEIEILAFMGGAEIKVPHHWQVSVKAIPFLGGVSNKTTCIAEKLNVPKKHLIISGLAFMGGIDIRN